MKIVPVISVILPVYNGEKYLSESINSVLDQSLREWELIIVDDGSTDATGRIADDYAGKDERIRVIHKKNEGRIYARKDGVRNACAKYIAFIDADDWMDEDLMETFMKNIEEYQADIVIADCIMEKQGSSEVRRNNISPGLYHTKEELDYLFSKMLYYEGFFKFGILPYLWNKLFRKDILESIYMDMDEWDGDSEDVAVVYPYLAMSDRILVIAEAKNHYRQHSEQSTQNKGDDFYEGAAKVYLSLKDNMRRMDCYELFLPQLDEYLRYLIWMKSPYSFPGAGKFFQMPFQKIPANSRIVLYGAGNVGKSYYDQIQATMFCNVVCWIDQNYKDKNAHGMKMVKGVDSLWDKEFDYILIAIADTSIVEKVRQSYIEKGIEAEKIVY